VEALADAAAVDVAAEEAADGVGADPAGQGGSDSGFDGGGGGSELIVRAWLRGGVEDWLGLDGRDM
jgi:hypothetical protein